jgi:hypothetical protein
MPKTDRLGNPQPKPDTKSQAPAAETPPAPSRREYQSSLPVKYGKSLMLDRGAEPSVACHTGLSSLGEGREGVCG